MVESFMVALNAVMPFLLLLSVGFLSVRAGLTDRAFMQRLNTLNFRLFFPFLFASRPDHQRGEGSSAKEFFSRQLRPLFCVIRKTNHGLPP